MSGYYEWQATPGGKQPWYFTARDGSPLLTAAGLWDEWKNHETGERLKSCTMIAIQEQAVMAIAASEINELRSTCQALREELDQARGIARRDT